MKNYFFFFSVIVFFVGCVEPPQYPLEPIIEFESISKTTVNQKGDSLNIRFTFTDGDGDIGFAELGALSAYDVCSDDLINHDTLNLFIRDNRTGCYQPYNTPFIPEKGNSKSISGAVRVTIGGGTLCCQPPGQTPCSTVQPTDTARFTIQMKDRAGNISNIIDIPPIVIRCIN